MRLHLDRHDGPGLLTALALAFAVLLALSFAVGLLQRGAFDGISPNIKELTQQPASR
jgi:hypothetical protein